VKFIAAFSGSLFGANSDTENNTFSIIHYSRNKIQPMLLTTKFTSGAAKPQPAVFCRFCRRARDVHRSCISNAD
jgi:hypothetical protein